MNIAKSYDDCFYYDTDYLKKLEIVKKDPYRYILGRNEFNKCFNRKKRFFFNIAIPSVILYIGFRRNYELSRVKRVDFSSIMALRGIPLAGVTSVFLYLFLFTFLTDYDKLKLHRIAKLELQKFDPTWFNYDDVKYGIFNAPVYDSEDSVFGRLYLKRLIYEYYQLPGWIRRIREANPNIVNEVPPKYEFTPEGPRSKTNFEELRKKPLPFKLN